MVASFMLALLLQSATPAPRSATPGEIDNFFDGAAAAFTVCVIDTVKIGMITKAPPADFAAAFARSCKGEEAMFRSLAIAQGVARGRPKAEVEAEIDANIVNGRRIFTADQARFVATGKVAR